MTEKKSPSDQPPRDAVVLSKKPLQVDPEVAQRTLDEVRKLAKEMKPPGAERDLRIVATPNSWLARSARADASSEDEQEVEKKPSAP